MRRLIAATSIAALALAVSSVPAMAADSTVTGFEELEDAVDQCTDGDTITLGGPIGGDEITINCDLTLDLGGHSLDLNHIAVSNNTQLTITDTGVDGALTVSTPDTYKAAIQVADDALLTIAGGTITATGNFTGAGIGGGDGGSGGVIVITDNATVNATGGALGAGIGGGATSQSGLVAIAGNATVTARGGGDAAGIGGGSFGHDSQVMITGNATVSATGGNHGAGIGGGDYGTGHSIAIAGNVTVTATGGSNGAGIGGGYNGAGGTITIQNGATVNAHGGDGGAGIGGGWDGAGGNVSVSGATTVDATGGRFGAGIGGGNDEAGGTITIEGASITTARGGDDAAGIGGGYLREAGVITIGGNASVQATGDSNGAGLGGGWDGAGGDITITGNALVTALGGSNSSGVGGGRDGGGGDVTITEGAIVTAVGGSAIGLGNDEEGFGSVQLDAMLHTPSGEIHVPAEAAFVIGAHGTLLGTHADPTTGASIIGDGQIDNGGVIALAESLIDVDVTDHNYLVTFDTRDGSDTTDVRVFAPSFDTGFRTIPAAPTDRAWNTVADGTGDWFSATSELTSDTTLYAATEPATNITLTAPTTTVDQGDSLTFTITATDINGDPVDTADAVLTSSVPTDIIHGTTVTFVDASPHVITATLGAAQTSLTIEVTPAAVPEPEPEPDTAPTPGTDPDPTPVAPEQPVTPAPAADGDQQLATTGTDPATGGLTTLALLLLAAGGALLVIRRSITD